MTETNKVPFVDITQWDSKGNPLGFWKRAQTGLFQIGGTVIIAHDSGDQHSSRISGITCRTENSLYQLIREGPKNIVFKIAEVQCSMRVAVGNLSSAIAIGNPIVIEYVDAEGKVQRWRSSAVKNIVCITQSGHRYDVGPCLSDA